MRTIKKISLISVVTLVFLLSFSSVADKGSSSWVQWRGDPLHHAVTVGPGPENGDIIWAYQTNGQVYSSPVFYHGGMLIGSDDGNLYCFDPGTGDVRWKYRTNGPVQATAYIDGNRAYFGSFDRSMTCIELPENVDGRPTKLWNITVEGKIIGSCHPYQDSVIVADNEGYVYRFTKDGDLVWKEKVSESEFWASPVIDEGSGTGIIGDVGNRLFTFRLDDGSVRSITGFGPDSEIYSSGLLYEGRFYITDGEGRKLTSMDIDSSEDTWIFDVGYPCYSTPIVDGDRLYFSSFEYLWCIPKDDPNGDGNISDDEVIWSSPTHDFQGGSSPIVSGDRVYVGSDDYDLYCFDKMTGEEIWKAGTKGYIYSSPVLYNGSIYFGSLDRSVYCVGDRPPGLVISATLSPLEITADDTARLLINITDEEDNIVRDTVITLDTSAGHMAMPGSQAPLSVVHLDGGSLILEVIPIQVSSRSTMDISIKAEKEGLRDTSATIQLIIEPGEGSGDDEIELDETEDRIPYIIGVVILIILNMALLSILVLFKIRDLNTTKEMDQ